VDESTVADLHGTKTLLEARCSRRTTTGSLLPAIRAVDPRLFLEPGRYDPVLFEVDESRCTAAASSRSEVISSTSR